MNNQAEAVVWTNPILTLVGETGRMAIFTRTLLFLREFAGFPPSPVPLEFDLSVTGLLAGIWFLTSALSENKAHKGYAQIAGMGLGLAIAVGMEGHVPFVASLAAVSLGCLAIGHRLESQQSSGHGENRP